ncbi:2-5A-dependent ribonuclease-like isoform X1 [Ambystoma mexicanum]|uniref:2-5A-dependent ribonuclease-like isoform X1 n=1 Tax=Ambystoma mexicanum TaxID=8296 RepID=UPI0037E92FFA
MAAAAAASHQGREPGDEGVQSEASALQPTTQTNTAPFTMDNLLWEAVVEGKVEKVRQQLGQGTDVNTAFMYGWTPLLQAVQMEWDDTVDLLLERGADPLAKKDNGCTPFIIAGMLGNKKYLDCFLSKGADINETDSNGFTALMEAVIYGREETVKHLLQRGAEVNVERCATDEGKSKSSGGQTALMDAAKRGHVNMVSMLLEKGARVNHQDLHGRSAFLHALNSPEPTRDDVIRILLDKGAEVDIRDINGRTALFLAAEMKRPRLVKALLEKGGIEVDTPDNTGRTALQVAVKKDDYETSELLLESGADPTGKGLIREALINYNSSLVKLLLHHKAEVDPIGVHTPFAPVSKHWAGKLRQLHAMKRPLKGKLEIFVNDEYKIKDTTGVGIYLGIHDGHEVAVKMTMQGSANERFLREQQCLKYFQGRSHTMKLLATEEDDSRYYLCLMLCEKNLEEHDNQNLEDAKNILKDIFQAVEDLHQSNFVHQDVCPANILIDHRGKGYLADFDKSLQFEDSVANAKRELIKGDMKGLADLVLFLVSGGQVRCVPEGKVLEEVCPDMGAEARDLITKLLSQDEDHQAVKDFFKHPFFWNPDSQLRFLQDVGNIPDVKKSNKCTLVHALNRTDAIKGKAFGSWTSKIDKEVMDDMMERNQKYAYTDTVSSLLKFIRNMGEHLPEKPENIKDIVQNPAEYFLKRFPDLTLYVYETIRCSTEYRDSLNGFGFSLEK